MPKKFDFDYDYKNDSLFVYNPKVKSKGSIEFDDFIIDFTNKKEIASVELLNASDFFKGLNIDSSKIDKKMLNEIKTCKLEIIPKNNFIVIKFLFLFKSNKKLITPVFIPSISKKSPAVA